jgi:DNA-binding NarL/FixJ family response regulator
MEQRQKKKLNQLGLTPRQFEIALLLLKDTAMKDIAAALNIRKSCVQFHATHIYRKAGVKNRYNLMVQYLPEILGQ